MASKYIDIPLNLGKTGLVRDEEQVVQQVHILLQTEPGDFIDIPTYGTPIKRYLYEGIVDSTVNLLNMSIKHALDTWMGDQIRIDNINVLEDRDSHTLVVELTLFLLEFDKAVSIVEFFNA